MQASDADCEGTQREGEITNGAMNLQTMGPVFNVLSMPNASHGHIYRTVIEPFGRWVTMVKVCLKFCLFRTDAQTHPIIVLYDGS